MYKRKEVYKKGIPLYFLDNIKGDRMFMIPVVTIEPDNIYNYADELYLKIKHSMENVISRWFEVLSAGYFVDDYFDEIVDPFEDDYVDDEEVQTYSDKMYNYFTNFDIVETPYISDYCIINTNTYYIKTIILSFRGSKVKENYNKAITEATLHAASIAYIALIQVYGEFIKNTNSIGAESNPFIEKNLKDAFEWYKNFEGNDSIIDRAAFDYNQLHCVDISELIDEEEENPGAINLLKSLKCIQILNGDGSIFKHDYINHIEDKCNNTYVYEKPDLLQTLINNIIEDKK